MRFGVIVFPGTWSDRDCHHALGTVLGQPVEYVWHKDTDLSPFDCVILPGGFSYGDYLRTGAIARFSPVMRAVEGFAREGGLVLGICNGFQILLEARLLPGAMVRNRSLRFICQDVHLRLENATTPFTRAGQAGRVYRMPIAHAEGCYVADPMTLQALEDTGQVVFRYCTPEGEVTDAANPNGSLGNIAGICSRAGNVLGMMPHPERCAQAILGNEDGRVIFESLLGRVAVAPAAGVPALR